VEEGTTHHVGDFEYTLTGTTFHLPGFHRSTETMDAQGNQHLKMHFYVSLSEPWPWHIHTYISQVEGPLANGVVQCHMVKHPGQSDYEYKYLFVDVKGHERIYLENADTAAARSGKKPVTFFGVKWG
jgi:import inner membrane translocase subunit TIM21